jgi:hypothetical protein
VWEVCALVLASLAAASLGYVLGSHGRARRWKRVRDPLLARVRQIASRKYDPENVADL